MATDRSCPCHGNLHLRELRSALRGEGRRVPHYARVLLVSSLRDSTRSPRRCGGDHCWLGCQSTHRHLEPVAPNSKYGKLYPTYYVMYYCCVLFVQRALPSHQLDRCAWPSHLKAAHAVRTYTSSTRRNTSGRVFWRRTRPNDARAAKRLTRLHAHAWAQHAHA